MKWVKQAVKIALYTDSTNTDTRQARIWPAWVCGDFAVHHRAYSESIYQEDVWSVTHLPTGLLALEANTCELAQAASTCIMGFDWSHREDTPEWRTQRRQDVNAALAVLGAGQDVWLPRTRNAR